MARLGPPGELAAGLLADALELRRGEMARLGPPGELAAGLLADALELRRADDGQARPTSGDGGGAARQGRGLRQCGTQGPELLQAPGSLGSAVGEAFFIPLYDLFLPYGGVFRLNFGPKVEL